MARVPRWKLQGGRPCWPFGLVTALLPLLVSSVTRTSAGLFSQVQIAALEADGTLKMPADTEYVGIEIGCSDMRTMDTQWLPKHPRAFLVSFEPLLDKYAVLLARGTPAFHGVKKDMSVPLAHHHQRGIVLPLAVTPNGGPIKFHVSNVAGCSSAMQINTNVTWATFCKDIKEERQVDSITVNDVLRLVGDRIVKYIKVDAQGLDTSIFTTADKHLLRRVQMITTETRLPKCPPLYVGQTTCMQDVERMKELGFSLKHKMKKRGICTTARGCETDLLFVNDNFSGGQSGTETSTYVTGGGDTPIDIRRGRRH